MILDRMSWPDLEALDRDGAVAICCLSATEQHGRHLPLATDHLIGAEIVRRAERRMPDRLLALPAVWLGCSAHHMDFPGTLSARPETLQSVARDIVDSLARHGFRRVLFLNSHGGNQAALGVALQSLAVEYPEAVLVGASYWNLASDELGAIRDSGFGGLGHACELETSILLAIAPDLVRMDRAERDGIAPESRFTRGEMLAAPRAVAPRAMSKMTRHGVYGDPTLASAEKGERFLAVIVDAVEALCRDMLAGAI